MTWSIEHRQAYGTAPGPGQPRPSCWVPWRPAAGRTWRRGVDAMRWAIAALDHRPGSAEHTAALERLASVPDTTIRYEWRTPTGFFGTSLRLARTPRRSP